MNGPQRLFLRHNDKIWSAVAGGACAVLVGRVLKREDVETPLLNNVQQRVPGPLRSSLATHCEADENQAVDPSTASNPNKTKITPDDPATISTPRNGDDDYPNFSRHGSKALLPKLLTPLVYQQLKDLQTPTFGVTLEDIIRAGTMLPYGADPPRGAAGVYVGDADCYRVFSPLLIPLVEESHGVTLGKKRSTQNNNNDKTVAPPPPHLGGGSLARPSPRYNSNHRRLQRHTTNLDPDQIVTTQLDPTGEYILSTRMRLARNLNGFAFCSHIRRKDRRTIERLFQAIVNEDFRPFQGGVYVPLHALTNQQHEDWKGRRISFWDPDDFKLAANLGRDWPDSRGIYGCRNWDPSKHRDDMVSGPKKRQPQTPLLSVQEEIEQWEETPPTVIIWCNYDDHFWIISVNKGGHVQRVFSDLSDVVRQLELSLLERNHSFCVDPKLGFLTSSPGNIGTALRASMSVKLVRLGKQHPTLFQEILQRLHLEAKSDYAETDQRYTGIFDIANSERLGRTEVQWINIMIQGVAKLIELEKKLERGETVTLQDVDDVVKNVKA